MATGLQNYDHKVGQRVGERSVEVTLAKTKPLQEGTNLLKFLADFNVLGVEFRSLKEISAGLIKKAKC